MVQRPRGVRIDQEGFIKALLVRFGPSSYDDLMDSLTKLKKYGTVQEFRANFEALSNRFRGLFYRYNLSCFLSGLKDEIRLPVRMFNLNNLLSTYSLAKIQKKSLG